MSNLPPFVSIVVPCRNERARVGSCIRSIRGQRQLPAEFEIIVADGMSDDGTREAVRALAAEDARIRLVDNPGRIVSTGLNAAVRLATGDVIIRMDAHTEYAPDYVHN
jgi:glycosyltransferase involved in cell wall biosynthesis